MGGELRKQPRAGGEQFFDAGHVAEVGHGLAREHRIIGQAAFLRAFDLGVPIGAFDQPDGQPAIFCFGNVLNPFDQSQSALLIGLDRKPESIPAGERRIGQRCADDFER